MMGRGTKERYVVLNNNKRAGSILIESRYDSGRKFHADFVFP
jgi:hypothetical protein